MKKLVSHNPNYEYCSQVSTINFIDWASIIEDISTKTGVAITTDPDRWDLSNPSYGEIYRMWEKASFNKKSIKWINYYPGEHFPKETIDRISHYLNVSVHRSWISRIDPGYFAPWHWDVDDNETEYLSKGTPIRYSVSMDQPSMGHIFILGSDYIINSKQGATFEWNDYREWHAGINGGLTPKYMLHLLAYKDVLV